MSAIVEVSLFEFVLITIILGGGAAYMTGRAVAQTWRPLPLLLVYTLGLTAAVRFIHYALFSGSLLTIQYFIVDFIVLLVIGGIGFRVTKTTQIVGQYSWLYERQSPFSWRDRPGAPGS